MSDLNKTAVHPSWLPLVEQALDSVAPDYLTYLQQTNNWLPGPHCIFNAFGQPLDDTRYILFGESPYPRPESANGYAFWDNAATEIWSATGLAKRVNRATSLRNFIKMLLVAKGDLNADNTSQQAIATLHHSQYVQTIDELFKNLLTQGVLLLNASLALTALGVRKDAAAWQPFMNSLLLQLYEYKPEVELLLFGKIAERMQTTPANFPQLVAEHPYNLSFIHNQKIINFFKPLNLLVKS